MALMQTIITAGIGANIVLVALILKNQFLIIKIQKKMDTSLATYEAFLTAISGSLTSISTSVATLAAGINPSGLTAADAAQLQTDLGTLATAAAAAATAASTAAANAAAGTPAPAPTSTPAA